MANPELIRKFALPTIKAVCKMAKEAGILTMLHSCGKSMEFLDMLYNETDLNCINPLEVPPMGDVDLKEVKKRYGNKLCLMGNLNTTMMLRATVDEVEAAAKKAIDDAGTNGGFLLSTGDQLGRDTPEANIFKLVETAQSYGKY
jgi:uroporphyrinogen decarboxylase